MPAVSLVFLFAQALLSSVVYRTGRRYAVRSPLAASALVFVLGFALVSVLDTLVGLFAVETLLVAVYAVGLHLGHRTSGSA